MQDFTVGKTITVGINLYRANFKQYLWLSLVGHLWLLIPIYGWARYLAIAAFISYSSYQQLVPSSKKISYQQFFTLRVLWKLLLTAIMTVFIPCIYALVCFLLILMAIVIVFAVFKILFDLLLSIKLNAILELSPEDWVYFLIGNLSLIVICLLVNWSYSRFFVADLVLFEKSSERTIKIMKNSCAFSKKNQITVFQLILFAFAITIPVHFIILGSTEFVFKIIVFLQNNYLGKIISPDNIVVICLLLWFLSVNLITTPFWQSVKAVVYYQIMCDREGIDLTIKNFNN